MKLYKSQRQLLLALLAIGTGLSLLGVSFVLWQEYSAQTAGMHKSAAAATVVPQQEVEMEVLQTPNKVPLSKAMLQVRLGEGQSGSSSTITINVEKFPAWVEEYRTFTGRTAERIRVAAVRASIVSDEVTGLTLPRDSTILSYETDAKKVTRAFPDRIARAGYDFDIDEAALAIAQALDDRVAHITLAAPYREPVVLRTLPDGTTDTLELLSTSYSDFSNSTPGRNWNVHKVIKERLTNVFVPRGETYSHVAMIDAPITLAKGWKEDLGLFGGGAALTPGAGICQSSTSLYRAALLAGLPIVESRAHSLFVDHYEFYGVGLDVTVFPGVRDFRFKNDTPGDLVIQAYIVEETETVIVNIFGKDDGRTVAMKGPYFHRSKNRHPALAPLSNFQIGWVREITRSDGTVKEEPRISTYAKPVWNSLVKKYDGADGMQLLVSK